MANCGKKKSASAKKKLLKRCVFLDRDGVINEGINVNTAADMRLLPGAKEAIARLKKAGFLVVIVTNQGGLGEALDGSIQWKGHPLTRENLTKIHAEMLRLLGDDAQPDLIKICPHATSLGCPCRKPKDGMLREAAAELGIDLTKSYMVGDRTSDVLAGTNAGATGILVLSGPDGANCKDKKEVAVGTPIHASLKEAADWILSQKSCGCSS